VCLKWKTSFAFAAAICEGPRDVRATPLILCLDWGWVFSLNAMGLPARSAYPRVLMYSAAEATVEVPWSCGSQSLGYKRLEAPAQRQEGLEAETLSGFQFAGELFS
jgi:hypothetical protein